MARRKTRPSHRPLRGAQEPSGTLRIIGGRLRGSPIAYLGDPRTRPMKQRVREAAFNLLGDRVVGTHVLDLFSGTGALAWEAMSRGAEAATLLERHFPSARLIRQNAVTLGLDDRITVVAGDTFHWARQLALGHSALPAGRPWLVFCCPPYDLYAAQWDAMLQLIESVMHVAPGGSLFVIESDARLLPGQLPTTLDWDRREYPPAVLSLAQKEAALDSDNGG